eukprot:143629_1
MPGSTDTNPSRTRLLPGASAHTTHLVCRKSFRRRTTSRKHTTTATPWGSSTIGVRTVATSRTTTKAPRSSTNAATYVGAGREATGAPSRPPKRGSPTVPTMSPQGPSVPPMRP